MFLKRRLKNEDLRRKTPWTRTLLGMYPYIPNSVFISRLLDIIDQATAKSEYTFGYVATAGSVTYRFTKVVNFGGLFSLKKNVLQCIQSNGFFDRRLKVKFQTWLNK